MILAFSDDATVCVFDSVAQANSYCEAIDVRDGLYVFLNDQGFVLETIWTRTPEQKTILFIKSVSEGFFDLMPTKQKRQDLIQLLGSGEISIEPGPTAMRSLADLREAAAWLFSA